MSGPASETAVLLSAGCSLAVFACYFASILAAVPKHWGVPYKNRLSRYVARSRRGLSVEVLNAVFSLVRSIGMSVSAGVSGQCCAGVQQWCRRCPWRWTVLSLTTMINGMDVV